MKLRVEPGTSSQLHCATKLGGRLRRPSRPILSLLPNNRRKPLWDSHKTWIALTMVKTVFFFFFCQCFAGISAYKSSKQKRLLLLFNFFQVSTNQASVQVHTDNQKVKKVYVWIHGVNRWLIMVKIKSYLGQKFKKMTDFNVFHIKWRSHLKFVKNKVLQFCQFCS